MSKEKIRIGVVGLNSFGSKHIEGIRDVENAEVVAICDIDEEILKKKSEEFGITDCYTDYKEMLKRDDIDAITVATPDQMHMQITIDGLMSGKHVLCEKPMAHKLSECKEMVKAQKASGKKLMVGQVGRHTPSFVKAKELVESGVIGELFFVESEYAHDYATIPGIGGWRVDPVELRHPIIGGGCHAIDLLRWIAGNPTEISAYANKKVLTTWPVDDCFIAIFKLPNGAIGKVMTSVGCKRDYTMRTVLYGTRGTIIVDNTSTELTLFKMVPVEGKPYPEETVEEKIEVVLNNHNVAAEVREFCEAILNDTPVSTDGIEGASTVAVGEAIVESAKTGEKVIVDYNF